MDGIPVADYVAFDLETTGLSPETDEILEVAMVRFSRGEPAEKWSSLVNPMRPVPLKTLRLTHIDPSELQRSPAFTEVMPKLQEFRRDLPLVGHNSAFDAAFLQKRVEGFPGVPLYDTLELARIVVPGFHSYKLADLAREMGVPVSEAHRAYDDAEVSGVIFRLIQAAAFRMSERSRAFVHDLMGAGWPGAGVFVSLPAKRPTRLPQPSLFDEPAVEIKEVMPGIAPASPPAIDTLREPFRELLRGNAAVGAASVALLPGVAATLAQEAAGYARSDGKRLLLLGFPAECLPQDVVRAGLPGDYACLARLEEAAHLAASGAYSTLDQEQRRFLASLSRWSDDTGEGLLSEIQWGSAGYEVVPEVSCPPGMECRDTCRFAARCFYLAAEKRAAAGTGGLVAAAPVGAGIRIKTPYDLVLVWASQDLARSWQMDEPRVDLPALREMVKRLGFAESALSLPALMASAAKDLSRNGTASAETYSLALRLSGELEAAAGTFRRGQGPAPLDPPLLWRDLHIVEAAAVHLRDFGSPGDASGAVSLVEQNYGDESARGSVLVRREPWPSMAAVRSLKSGGARVLLFSDLLGPASASEGGRRSMGLGEAVETVDLTRTAAGSSVLLASLDGGRQVSPQEYARYLSGFIASMARVTRKGLLVAFPSRALLKETYSAVQPILEAEGIAVYGHGLDGGHRLVEHLEEDDAVVFGMAGSGPLPGDPVPRCLVLARVPFAPPNALDEVRKVQIQSGGGNSFVEVSVRPPALALRSHIQKMLQAEGPRAVVLADPRVLPGKSNWGQDFMSTFADVPRVVCPEGELLQRLRAHLKG